MTKTTVVSTARGCFVEIVHHDSDPNSWIVNRWRGIKWFRTLVSSNWFINGQQAYAFANELKRKQEILLGSARREDMS
jgi:hypothetical protein